MPRFKKPAQGLTDEEVAKKLFPKKVRDAVRKAVEPDTKTTIKKNDTTD